MAAGDFYARLEPDPALARSYFFLLDVIAAYTAKGRLDKAAQARAILQRMRGAFEQLGIRAPGKADEFIRARLGATAVRPPTGGTLERAIQSAPIATSVPTGATAIASIDALDRGAVNPRSGGIYWRAQEYGLPVDPDAKPVPGYFQPGFARPDPGQFRNHPYFEQFRYSRGMPALVRRRPLAARHYLRDGSREFAAWHNAQSERIMREAIAALARL